MDAVMSDYPRGKCPQPMITRTRDETDRAREGGMAETSASIFDSTTSPFFVLPCSLKGRAPLPGWEDVADMAIGQIEVVSNVRGKILEN